MKGKEVEERFTSSWKRGRSCSRERRAATWFAIGCWKDSRSQTARRPAQAKRSLEAKLARPLVERRVVDDFSCLLLVCTRRSNEGEKVACQLARDSGHSQNVIGRGNERTNASRYQQLICLQHGQVMTGFLFLESRLSSVCHRLLSLALRF